MTICVLRRADNSGNSAGYSRAQPGIYWPYTIMSQNPKAQKYCKKLTEKKKKKKKEKKIEEKNRFVSPQEPRQSACSLYCCPSCGSYRVCGRAATVTTRRRSRLLPRPQLPLHPPPTPLADEKQFSNRENTLGAREKHLGPLH